jgi:hypothetical protein
MSCVERTYGHNTPSKCALSPTTSHALFPTTTPAAIHNVTMTTYINIDTYMDYCLLHSYLNRWSHIYIAHIVRPHIGHAESERYKCRQYARASSHLLVYSAILTYR